MNLALGARLLGVGLVTLVATELCARLAPRLGWTDAPRPGDGGRKRQGRAVPAVGGVALLIGVGCAPEAPFDLAWIERAGGTAPGAVWLYATLAAVLAVGTWDDRAGLGAGKKALAELAALAPLALGVLLAGSGSASAWLTALALLFLGFLALNTLNTFDNADGALATLCALGCASALPFVAAACVGFLPLNLDARRARHRASGAPTAYLGDAGAFVLGLFVALSPRTFGVLVVPLLDLGRLAALRLAAGSRPWIGDRRHLAHRLQARGLAPWQVALAQAVIAAPACLLLPRACDGRSGSGAALGLGATAALFGLALFLTRFPLPCPREDASE